MTTTDLYDHIMGDLDAQLEVAQLCERLEELAQANRLGGCFTIERHPTHWLVALGTGDKDYSSFCFQDGRTFAEAAGKVLGDPRYRVQRRKRV